MEKIKLPKGNLYFVENPIVKEFIKYCKENYADNINEITLKLHEEHNDWQMTVKSEGNVWVPWFIPTSNTIIVSDNLHSINKKLYEPVNTINHQSITIDEDDNNLLVGGDT